jgi:hypothetical protein
MSKIYETIYLSIFLEVTRRSGRLTKVDSQIAMSLKKWLKKSSKVLIRTFSLFLPSRIVFRLLLAVRRPQYGFRRQWGLSMPLKRGMNHLCYSLRPAIVQTKLAQEIFYLRLNDPFCYDLVLGKKKPIIGEWPSENVTKGITIIEGFRWAFTGQGSPPDLKLLASVEVVLVVVSKLIHFNKTESTIASVV